MGASSRQAICLSSQPWHDPLWTNKQHIMNRLAERGWRVLYVDPPSPRRAVFAAGRLRPRRLARMLRAVPARPNLSVWRSSGLVRRPAGALGRAEARLLARAAHRIALTDPVLWVYHPPLAPVLEAFPGALVLYDCVDDTASFPQLADAADEVRALEDALLARADLVTASSRALLEAVSPRHANAHLVENVGDFAHFQRAGEVAPDPAAAAIRRPCIGFVGALGAYKLDAEFVADCARRKPGWSFAFVGPEDPETARAWRDLPNVVQLGFRPYAELPAVMAAFDALWIPYRRSAYTRACFPIKFFEYLATGKPVAVTPLPALERYAPLVRIASKPEAMVLALEHALERDPPQAREARLAAARANTWDHRIDRILALLEETERRTRSGARSGG